MTLRFHPLADLFPLIEGAEFDELVKSIKDNGQHDPIVLLEEMILDGRNRYRACLAADVVPRFEQFTGNDAVAFVMDHNIHRRHLNESQRALIAAKLSNLKHGQRADYANRADGAIAAPAMSASKAADMLNVNRASVVRAKTVLAQGTAEEIKSVEQGHAAVSTIAREITAKLPAKVRKARRDDGPSRVGKNPQRFENQRINSQIWAGVRTGLTAFTSLPIPSDVVAIVRAYDKTGLVDRRIGAALEWLQEFADAWCNRDKAKAVGEAAANGDRYDHAGNGDTAS